MPIALAAVAVIEVAATVASAAEQKSAAGQAANVATQTAAYNAKVDQADAAQIDADTIQNIDNERQDAAVYMSKQASAYVASGIVANSGSALAVQVATAGKFAQREQQQYADAQAKEENLASQAQAGVAYGAAQADADHMEGLAAIIGGAGKVATEVGGAYSGGAFSAGSGAGGGIPGPTAAGQASMYQEFQGGTGTNFVGLNQ